jgi:putative aldouronate transport system permease protein
MKAGVFKRELSLHLLLLPAVVLTLLFHYGPMFGMVMAFQNFDPALGFCKSVWVGLANFHYLANLDDLRQVLWNTVGIAVTKLGLEMTTAIILALLLNEVRSRFWKSTVQTIVYFPHYLSWIILGGILREILAYEGLLNKVLGYLGLEPLLFLGDNRLFPAVLVATYLWQRAGFAMIVYLAALTRIDPQLYEAAVMDGAGRWAQTVHVTLPGIKSVIVLMATLSLANLFDAGFAQVYALYSPVVYRSGDIVDTWVYRMGMLDSQYSLAAAVDLLKAAVSCLLISGSYYLAYRVADYRIF